MTNKKRAIVIFMAVTVVFVMFFSSFFVAKNTKHNCVGEHCSICLQIENCKTALRELTFDFLTVCIEISAAILILFTAFISYKIYIHITLVSLKVKLSN